MTITSFRAAEPLYIVFLKNTNQAEAMLKNWIKVNRVEHASVSGNRMLLYDQHGFEQFRISWTHDMNMITIWDTWIKRHIYLD